MSDFGKMKGTESAKKMGGESTERAVEVTKNGCMNKGTLQHRTLQTATLNSSTASMEMKADLALPSNPPLLSGVTILKNWSKKP
jgi:hypothetical protein